MAYCTQCGAKLEEGTKFCTNCGTPINPPVPPQGWQYESPVDPGEACRNRSPVQGYYDAPGSGVPNIGNPGFTFGSGANSGKKTTRTGLIVVLSVLGFLLIVALAAVIGIGMTGGSTGKADKAVLGRYEGVSCISEGLELGADEDWIELKSGGKTDIHIFDDTYRGTWTLDGENITITQDGDDYCGTLRDQVLQIQFEHLDYTFAMAGAVLPGSKPSTGLLPTAPSVTPTQQGNYLVADYWAKDWYGWWILQNGTGEWAELNGNFWDTCARILVNEDGTGYIEIWDEDNKEDESFCATTLTFDTDQAEQGVMVSQRGKFWTMDIGRGDWTVHPEMGLGVENGFCISGKYIDPESPSDTFEYEIYLRPWGTLWDDLQDLEGLSCPYDDMMPGLYESWYLPLVQAGVTKAPDKIGNAQPSEPSGTIMQNGATLGEGNTSFIFAVVDTEGVETYATVKTDKTTVGDALMELGLISGDQSQYGLHVKTVNGITLDYDTNGWYWAFYIDDLYSMTGVDSTEIIAGAVYTLKAERG